MNGILYAFLGTLFTFSVTTLGALNVFMVRKKVDNDMQCLTLGFAGGVMVAASIWSLLIPGIARADELHQVSWLVMAGGFLCGVSLLLLADHVIKKKYFAQRNRGKQFSLSKSTIMLVLAITAHNIPEGMAVGLAFALAAQKPENANLLSGAIALTIGIGIQNYPEGTAVAFPLMSDGMNKKRAFFIGSMSALVEPVFGVLAALLAGTVLGFMPLFLALAAGSMIYVVVQELIPEAHMGEKETIGTLGFVAGFIVMMILDVALG